MAQYHDCTTLLPRFYHMEFLTEISLFGFSDFRPGKSLGWRQDNGNRSNQESKFDFLATPKRLVKIGEGQQKIKIVRTNRQSNLRGSCQSIFSLCRHHPSKSPAGIFIAPEILRSRPHNDVLAHHHSDFVSTSDAASTSSCL